MRHNCARRGQNVLRRSVILLQLNNSNARKVLLERQDVLDVGPAPTVDGLVLIADDANVIVHARQMTH